MLSAQYDAPMNANGTGAGLLKEADRIEGRMSGAVGRDAAAGRAGHRRSAVRR